MGPDQPARADGEVPGSSAPHYSLDNILPPRAPQYIDGSPVAWMIVGHGIWIAATAISGPTGAGAGWLAVPGAHLLALILVVVAWATRASSVVAARAVAWVSTPVLGITLAGLATVFVSTVSMLITFEQPEFEGSLVPIFGSLYLVVVVVLSVPTIGAFVAAVSHARSLRGA